ncbi:MAG TPA: hypothetical protein VK395_04115 [Gemmataceae bacterium]|nr:hypothetical protein [Gemmataceae bacterium]
MPDGSLANGWMVMEKPGKSDPWSMVKPDLEQLWEEYAATRVQG